MNSQEYIEVRIRIEPFSDENAEIVMAEISELPYEAFVTEAPGLLCYIQKEAYDARRLKILLSGCRGMGISVDFSADMVRGANWNIEWEKSFTPIAVDGKVTVRAPFNEDVRRTRFNIVIEPRMAFGTGYHDTTFMMIRQMLAMEKDIRGRTVMDIGCGTAILAILAAKMRAAKAYAIDIDAVAAQSAFDNARRNRVGRLVESYCGDASLLQMGKYDVILANINRNTLIQDMCTYARSLRKGGTLLTSGFLEKDIPLLRDAAGEHGLAFRGEDTRNGWACIRFGKEA